MTTTTARPASSPLEQAAARGWLARLGAWSGSHFRLGPAGLAGGPGVFGAFAPQVSRRCPVPGWQDSSSSSVKARDIITKDFAGLSSTALQVVVHDSAGPIASRPGRPAGHRESDRAVAGRPAGLDRRRPAARYEHLR